MIIPFLAAVLVLSAALTGHGLSRFGQIRIRHGWIVAVALAAQVVAMQVLPGAARPVLSSVHIATYLAAGGFVWLNRAVPGLWLVALGAASNGVTIAVNGGTLPASASALRTAGLDLDSSEFNNSGVLTDPHLPWLGDVFALPAGIPLANVFSVGDVLVLCGVAWGAHRICGSRLVPRWDSTPATPQQVDALRVTRPLSATQSAGRGRSGGWLARRGPGSAH